jgi:phage shock protein C
MLGGVAAGLAQYFNTDVNVIRLLMVLAAFFTGGAFLAVYIALWLLLPTVTSTSNDVGGIMQENLNEMGRRVGLSGKPNGGNTPPAGTNASAGNGGGPVSTYSNQGQPPQAGTAATRFSPPLGAVILIAIGTFLLLSNFGIFHFFRWHFFWPLVLVGLGVMLLMRKR